jgi:acetoin utilization deacetylase AcuC-like enzyme
LVLGIWCLGIWYLYHLIRTRRRSKSIRLGLKDKAHTQDVTHGLLECHVVESPERIECCFIDGQHRIETSLAPSSHPLFTPSDVSIQGSPQQRQLPDGRKPVGDERTLFDRGERCGDDAAVSIRHQAIDNVGDRGGVEWLIDERGNRSDAGIAPPRSDSDSSPTADRQVLHLRTRHIYTMVPIRYNCRPTVPGVTYHRVVALMLITHERCLDHVAGHAHPERPDRLRAALEGISALDLGSDLVRQAAEPAPREALLSVHDPRHIEKLAAVDAQGGGRIDADTRMNDATWEAAQLAAGAGLQGIAALDAGEAEAVFCAVRPPGHHATPTNSMGFCFLNNVAVAAMSLADRGERVLVLDYDAHHGNGTQDVFYDDPRVLFVSFHQMPLYPGTGALEERGVGDGVGATVNVPMPIGATGDHYRSAWDEVIAPLVQHFDPTWLLVSAGFDGHRSDPLTQLGLTSADFADLTLDAFTVVPAGRRMVFLEGGYDLTAIRDSAESVVGSMMGKHVRVEPPTSGGPGAEHVMAAAVAHAID